MLWLQLQRQNWTEPWFTCSCASGSVTQQILLVVWPVSFQTKLLQAHDSHRKSQDFPNWICNSLSPSACLEDSTTWTQHLMKRQVLRIFLCWLCSSIGFFFCTTSKQDVSRRALCYTSWHAAAQMLKRKQMAKNCIFFAEYIFSLFMGSMWEQTITATHPSWYSIGCCASAFPFRWTCSGVTVSRNSGSCSSASTQCFHFETWKRNPGVIRLILWFFCKEVNIFSVKTFFLQFPMPEIPVLSRATLIV